MYAKSISARPLHFHAHHHVPRRRIRPRGAPRRSEHATTAAQAPPPQGLRGYLSRCLQTLRPYAIRLGEAIAFVLSRINLGLGYSVQELPYLGRNANAPAP